MMSYKDIIKSEKLSSKSTVMIASCKDHTKPTPVNILEVVTSYKSSMSIYFSDEFEIVSTVVRSFL